MRLKVLIPPFFIVMILILVIGFIKPDLDVLKMKKADILTKEEQMKNMAAVIKNAGTLDGSLDAERDFEKSVFRFLPDTLNQEQAIDAFNFLATQAGVVIAKVELKESLQTAIVAEEGNGEAAGADQAYTPPSVKTFILTGSVIGSYENVKTFFDRLLHMERFQEVNFFSIATDTKTQPIDTSHLIGTFEAQLGYLPLLSNVSALNMPIFLRPQFDFSSKSKLSERTTSVVPVLEKGNTGRPNPFQ